MVRHRGPVLVDTMIMITAHGVGAWRALAGGYQIETVEECLTEIQTGPLNRQQAQQIMRLHSASSACHSRYAAMTGSRSIGVAKAAAGRSGSVAAPARILRRVVVFILCILLSVEIH